MPLSHCVCPFTFERAFKSIQPDPRPAWMEEEVEPHTTGCSDSQVRNGLRMFHQIMSFKVDERDSSQASIPQRLSRVVQRRDQLLA